ncbi:hypothetical protein SAMN05428939_3261 [Streptomyces sp. TLI_105]|nr:hypothetical protein SAMN05428939_3261 [Streptomyces sp. TLI_105]
MVLTSGGLTGCSSLSAVMGLGSCEGSEERVEQLRSLALLDAPPEGATEVRGYEGVEAECWEDSGDAAISADHMYVHPGTPAEVIRHYRTAAARDGWLPGPSRPAPPRVPIDLCFTRNVNGTPTILTVWSLTPGTFGASEGHPFPPELTTGSGFLVEAMADPAGEPIDCED